MRFKTWLVVVSGVTRRAGQGWRRWVGELIGGGWRRGSVGGGLWRGASSKFKGAWAESKNGGLKVLDTRCSSEIWAGQ